MASKLALFTPRNFLKIRNISILTSTRSCANIYCIAKPRNMNILKNVTRMEQRRSTSFFSFFRKKSAAKLKIADNVPDEYNLIYRNTLQNYVVSAQFFSSVCAVLICAVVVLYQGNKELESHFETWREEPGTVESEVYIYLTAFVTLCVLLQMYVARIPLRVYNHPKQQEYIFVLCGFLPGSKKHIFCKLKEITKLEASGILPWKDHYYELENKGKIILLESCFRKPSDLNIMLGYEKQDET